MAGQWKCFVCKATGKGSVAEFHKHYDEAHR